MGIMDSLRSKYELYRLEQKYARRDKRTTFASAAQYVDGEYIYVDSPRSTSSSKSWGSSSSGNNSWQGKRGASVKVKEMMAKTHRA